MTIVFFCELSISQSVIAVKLHRCLTMQLQYGILYAQLSKLSKRTNMNFRLNEEQIGRFQRLADFVIPPGKRGQRGATRVRVIEILCSDNPSELRFLADGISRYADLIEKK